MEEDVFPSTYNIYFSDGKGENYIFNTWHGNLIHIESDYLSAIKSENIDFLPKSMQEQLLKAGILTKFTNEFSEVLKENENHKREYESNRFSICILPTLGCNAHCYYCFEKGALCQEGMDVETEQALFDYIRKNSIKKKVHITWFGGEPLLKGDFIEHFSLRLSEAGIPFHSTMITNGFLIDKYIEEMANHWKLKQVQITLDGLYDRYDEIKKIGNGAFNKVISNIHLLLNHGIHVAIRINYNSSNLGDYENLVDFVHKEFGTKVILYFHDIVGSNFYTPDEVDDKPILKIYKKLFDSGYLRNLRDLRITRKFSPCSVNSASFLNVHPNGWANKCEHFVGKSSVFDVGNISSDNFQSDLMYGVIHERCSHCKCFPICGGGCQADHMIRPYAGCFRGRSCIEEILSFYVDEVLPKHKG